MRVTFAYIDAVTEYLQSRETGHRLLDDDQFQAYEELSRMCSGHSWEPHYTR